MGENSNIEWCDATWQVTHGCKKIAAGCANCYAIKDAHRMAGHPNAKISGPRQGLTRKVGNVIDWTGVVRTAPENLAWPLRKKKPLRIFVNSNSDLFHDAVPFEFIAAVYGVMAACPQHLFIILTKRPKRMREFVAWASENIGEPDYFDRFLQTCSVRAPEALSCFGERWHGTSHWPLPNVIHGYSAANQADLDAGIADLLATPSTLRCLSLEPLVGPIDLTNRETCEACNGEGFFWVNGGGPSYVKKHGTGRDGDPIRHKVACEDCGGDFDGPGTGERETLPDIDWVIVGGESGPGARPCGIAWIRSIVEQCKAAGVPVFVKQLGAKVFTTDADMDFKAAEKRGDAYACYVDRTMLINGGGAAVFRCEGGEVVDEGDAAYPWPTTGKGGDPSEWPEDLRIRQFPQTSNSREL